MGIRRFCFLPDFQARWKEWKTRFGFLSFPRFPRGVISTALFVSLCSERSDAARALVAALLLSSFSASFFVLGQNLTFPRNSLAPGSPRNDDLAASRRGYPPFGAHAFLPPRSLRMDSPCISRW